MELIYFYVFCAIAVLFSTLALFFALFSFAKVVGMEKSTHRVQMVPMEMPGAPSLDEGIGMNPSNAAEMMKNLYPEHEEL